MNKYIKLIISVLIPLIVGFLGSFFTSSSVNTWYKTLNKPGINPPSWIFAPVWTILFILIGVSFYLIWEKNFGENKKKVISIYCIQLFLNFIWSLIFFGLKNPFLSFIEIIVLWFVILVNIVVFYKIKKLSGVLLIPYILWVSFALILNYLIVVLN